MVKINDLFLSLPESWAAYPFKNLILGSRKSDNAGSLQILLGYKDNFDSIPNHDECTKIALRSASKNKLPEDKEDIFRVTHKECCLIGALVYSDDASFERIYYKYVNHRFIIAIYRSAHFPEKEDNIYMEINESDLIIESLYFE